MATVAPTMAAIVVPAGLDRALLIAQAIAAPVTNVTGASFVTTTTGGTPNGISDAPLAGFGASGASFGILTTGNVSNVAIPTAIANTNNNGNPIAVRGTTAKDISVLQVGLNVPQGANCLTFDFKFLSTEYPGYVGTTYNDAFIAELDDSTWTTSGSTISAPDNFAFDDSGKVVSINSTGLGGMTAARGTGTPFNGSRPYSDYGVPAVKPGTVGGATGLLRASKQVTPGAHTVFFSIFDQGDQLLDSAVFLDNLVVGFVPAPETNCKPGAQPANFTLALTPAAGTAPTGTEHTVTATLTDAAGTVVTGAPIGFTVAGANAGSGTVATNGSGQAMFTYTGTVVGTDQIAACYQPVGATSCLAQAAATWDWTAVATSLKVAAATGIYGGTATLSATLTQGGSPLVGQPVTFTLNGTQAGTATTDANGVATVIPPTGLGAIGAGSYPSAIKASFAGSSGLLASSAVGALTVAKAPLTVTANNTSKVFGQDNPVFTASYSGLVNGEGPSTLGGTLSFATSATAASPVGGYDVTPGGLTSPNYAITFAKGTLVVTPAPATLAVTGSTFTFDGTAKTATATTTPGGLSVAITYNGSAAAPTDAGSYAVVAHLTDPNYTAPDATGTLVITKAPSIVTVTAANATYDGQPRPATAVVTGAGGLSQALTVSYSGRGDTIYPASAIPPTNAGSYTASASFGGDANHTGSQGSADFAIGKIPTTLVLTSPANLQISGQGTVTVTAKLTTLGGTPLAGKTVTFSVGGVSASGTTAANGVATATLTLPSEQYALTASFAGDNNHLPSAAAAQTIIAYQLTRFVIWGGNVGGVATGKTYQFWGAQWAKQVTGGDYRANNSFKGYADILSPDGKTWTASPGGSGNPPATVAPYIGVIVATQATKDGATTSGNVEKIVILKVDAPASYQPNPGHAGLGVLVATLP